jgi:hypothetical protein
MSGRGRIAEPFSPANGFFTYYSVTQALEKIIVAIVPDPDPESPLNDFRG